VFWMIKKKSLFHGKFKFWKKDPLLLLGMIDEKNKIWKIK
jgi:hypothetical protein